MNNAKATLISLFIAGIGMLLVWSYVQQTTEDLKKDFGTPVSVVIASEEIGELEVLKPSALMVVNIPSKFVQPGSVSRQSDVVNTVAAIPLLKGSIITRNMLLIKGPDTGLSSQVSIGKRAISIPINEVNGVTKMIRPGDRIDILVSIQWGKGKFERDVKPILQDVLIVAAGQRIANDIPQAIKDDDGRQKKNFLHSLGKFNTVTIEVTPQEALELAFMMTEPGGQQGFYYLLRNPADREMLNIPPVSLKDLSGGKVEADSGKLK